MAIDSDFKKLFSDSQGTEFGCVLFDQRNQVDNRVGITTCGGWASIDGGSAFRINSVGDLANNVKWLTNLPQDILWRSGLVKQSKLKHSGYLKTDVYQLAKEMGLGGNNDIVKIAESLSKAFSKIMKLAVSFYGLTEFNQIDLPTEIKIKIYPNDVGVSTYVDEALSRAYQDLVICEKPIRDGQFSYVALKRERYSHAKSVLAGYYPIADAGWVFYGDVDLPRKEQEKIDFLLKQDKPFLAKINIKSFKQCGDINVDLGRLIVLGETIGEQGRKKDRNWVCNQELIYLNRFVNIEISAAFVASEYINSSSFVRLPHIGNASDNSLCLGILSECVWLGVSSRSINPQTKSKSLVSPRACWLRALDRFFCLSSAIMLSSAGFVVSSYGFGGVSVEIENGKIPSLIDIAKHAGLKVPLSIVASSPA